MYSPKHIHCFCHVPAKLKALPPLVTNPASGPARHPPASTWAARASLIWTHTRLHLRPSLRCSPRSPPRGSQGHADTAPILRAAPCSPQRRGAGAPAWPAGFIPGSLRLELSRPGPPPAPLSSRRWPALISGIPEAGPSRVWAAMGNAQQTPSPLQLSGWRPRAPPPPARARRRPR